MMEIGLMAKDMEKEHTTIITVINLMLIGLRMFLVIRVITFIKIGMYYYKNGERYYGDLKNEERSGKGICYYPNNDRYDGDWDKGVRTGKGIM